MKEFVISEAKVETAVLVGLITQTQDERKTNEYLDELAFLAETAGAEVVKRFTQKLPTANSVTYVGKGKLEEIRQYIRTEEEEEREVGMVIFDDELSAKQIRNIEAELKVKDTRPYFTDPRYICDACTDCQCENAGRTGSVQIHVTTFATTLDSPGTSGWWLR